MSEKLSRENEQKIRSAFVKFPFPQHLGFEITKLDYGYACMKLPYKHEITQGQNYIHGGAIASLGDSAVAFALATMIDGGENMLTIEFKINFTAPADDDIFAHAKIIHKGSKTAVGEADIKKSDGTLVAKSIVTYYLPDQNRKDIE
jgi:uncharacterized protein (TIGR00369 family)